MKNVRYATHIFAYIVYLVLFFREDLFMFGENPVEFDYVSLIVLDVIIVDNFFAYLILNEH